MKLVSFKPSHLLLLPKVNFTLWTTRMKKYLKPLNLNHLLVRDNFSFYHLSKDFFLKEYPYINIFRVNGEISGGDYFGATIPKFFYQRAKEDDGFYYEYVDEPIKNPFPFLTLIDPKELVWGETFIFSASPLTGWKMFKISSNGFLTGRNFKDKEWRFISRGNYNKLFTKLRSYLLEEDTCYLIDEAKLHQQINKDSYE